MSRTMLLLPLLLLLLVLVCHHDPAFVDLKVCSYLCYSSLFSLSFPFLKGELQDNCNKVGHVPREISNSFDTRMNNIYPSITSSFISLAPGCKSQRAVFLFSVVH